MNILQLVNQDGYNLEILHAGSPNNSFLIGGSVIPLALTSEFKGLGSQKFFFEIFKI